MSGSPVVHAARIVRYFEVIGPFRWTMANPKRRMVAGGAGFLTMLGLIKTAVEFELNGAVKTAAFLLLLAWLAFAFTLYVSAWWDRYHGWKARSPIAVFALVLTLVWYGYLPSPPANDTRDIRPAPVPQTDVEKPDLILKLSSGTAPSDPLLIVIATLHNQKQALADKIRYTFELSNQRALIRGLMKEAPGFKPRLDRLPAGVANKVAPTAYVRVDSFTNPDQWVKGKQDFEIGPINASPLFLDAVKLGDELVGAVTVTCANCERVRGYWIFYKVGLGGWFAETADGSEPTLEGLLKSMNVFSEKEREDYFTNPETYLASKLILTKQPISRR